MAPTYDNDMPPEERRGRFDRAVLFFNAGEYYEAHEDWEAIWHESEGDERRWIQGLIQYAAAFVHWRRGFHASGFHRLMAQATEKCTGYTGPLYDLSWEALQRDLAPWIAHGLRVAADEAPLRDESMPEPPIITYVDGFEPQPLPPEDDEPPNLD